MKNIINLIFIFGIILIATNSCQKNNDLWELSFNSNKKVIETTVENVRFKFCLLNEKGEEANSFNEGENFSFFLELENTGNEDLCMDPAFLYNSF